jgi:hypothetical protein
MANQSDHFDRELERLDKLVQGEAMPKAERSADRAGIRDGVGKVFAPNGHVTVVINQSAAEPAREIQRRRRGGKGWRQALLDGIRGKAADFELTELQIREIAQHELRARLLVVRLEDLTDADLARVYDKICTTDRPGLD